MKVIYDKQKLKEIIDSICNLTGISMCIMDTQFISLYTREKKEDAFCHKIQNTEQGKEKCRCSDEKMLEECARTKAPVSHICHAGLIDTVVPIIKSGVVAGFIVIGRIRPDSECKIKGVEKDYRELTYLTGGQLDSLVNLLSNILFENALRIEYDDFISRASEYIKQNLDKKLSIDILCKELFVSKNFLYESFHSFYGCTVNEYVTRLKIEKAKDLLAETNQSVAEISKALGFESYPYFCKLIKRRTGKNPTEYRKKS